MLARRSQRFWGILTKKERWGLSWRGRLICATTIALMLWLLLLKAYPFLSMTRRVNTKVLIVEGWIHESAIRVGAEEFKTGSYQRAFTTGGPVEGTGGYTSDFMTSASVGAALLRKAGVPDDAVQMVPSRVAERDRTYSSAVALREWLHGHDLEVGSMNIVTEDAHARRTRLLFQKAFGNGIEIGVIAVPSPDYDGMHWWRSSEGTRQVIGEGIAYLYTKVFFAPSRPKGGHEKG